jgi:hypothetical protein
LLNVRRTGSILTLVLCAAVPSRVAGQTLSPPHTVAPPSSNTLLLPQVTPPPASALFGAAAQIIDRPTADLRSRFHWGVFGSFVPMWSIPGGMGNLFFEDPDSPKMRGRDFRVGIVRGRQLGFEMGGSFVRKTITSLSVRQGDSTNSGFVPTSEYTTSNPVHMTGVDAHLMIPFARFGERAQLGVLAGGGLAWLPHTPIQVRIEGPPFYASASMTTPLSTPPATGGFVQQSSSLGIAAVPLVPGTRYGLGEGRLADISPSDGFWMLLRAQLVADILLAPPLKLRFSTGFNYPGVQAVGIDAVYLFRTGRGDLDPLRGVPGSAAPPGQIVDQPDVLAPRRSYWGVVGGVTPRWWNPDSWGKLLDSYDPTNVEGRELRIGVTRGRPLGYEFGVSFVRKSMKPFTYQRIGYTVNPITLTSTKTIQIPGGEFHTFVPISRIGSRVQLGTVLGLGAARMPDAVIQKRIPGPPYYATATDFSPLTTPPAAGGFVEDDYQQRIPVAPGQTAAVTTVDASDISPYGRLFVLMRGEIAADVLVARPLKLRFSGGFNSPGAHLFNVEVVYLFGTGRN